MCRREAMLRQLDMELKQERSLTETMVADMVCRHFRQVVLYSAMFSPHRLQLLSVLLQLIDKTVYNLMFSGRYVMYAHKKRLRTA